MERLKELIDIAKEKEITDPEIKALIEMLEYSWPQIMKIFQDQETKITILNTYVFKLEALINTLRNKE